MEEFPPKPVVEETPPNPNRSLISLVIFMLAFYFLFDQDLRLLLVMVGVLIIHEMGHFIAMRQLHYKELQMFFLPLVGAMVTGNKREISQKERTLVILAGPLPGIVFGVALYYVAIRYSIPDLELPANLFLVLNWFNLLPFTPLDGGRLIETLFFVRNTLIQYSFLILSCVALILVSIFMQSYFLLIIPLFLILSLSARIRIERIRKKLKAQGLDYQKGYEELSDEEYWRIRDEVLRQVPVFPEAEVGRHESMPQEERMVAHLKTVLQRPPVMDLSWAGRLAVVLLWLIALAGPLLMISLMSEGAPLLENS